MGRRQRRVRQPDYLRLRRGCVRLRRRHHGGPSGVVRFTGGSASASSRSPTVLHNLALSPNQRQLIGSSAEPGPRGLSPMGGDFSRGVPTRLIPDSGGGLWSEDAPRIAFTALRQPGSSGIYIRTLAGQTQERTAAGHQRAQDPQRLVARRPLHCLRARGPENAQSPLGLTARRRLPAVRVSGHADNEIEAHIRSRWASGFSCVPGAWEVYVQSFPTAGREASDFHQRRRRTAVAAPRQGPLLPRTRPHYDGRGRGDRCQPRNRPAAAFFRAPPPARELPQLLRGCRRRPSLLLTSHSVATGSL